MKTPPTIGPRQKHAIVVRHVGPHRDRDARADKERIRALEARDREIREARLVWAMTCDCRCPGCQGFDEVVNGTSQETEAAPSAGVGQLCHLCNNVHDLMSTCPPRATDCGHGQIVQTGCPVCEKRLGRIGVEVEDDNGR
jgi:hypothetical protein